MRDGVSLPNFGGDLSVRVLADLARRGRGGLGRLFPMGPRPGALSGPGAGGGLLDRVDRDCHEHATQPLRPPRYPLPRRRPTKLVRETASLDQLSGGRLILGVGIGALPYEWKYLGEDADPKVCGSMLDEGWRPSPVC